MKTSPIFSVHLGVPLKIKCAEHCHKQSVKPSAALRQVVIHLLNLNSHDYTPASEVIDQPDETRNRIEIKLTNSELAKIQPITEAAGYSKNLWISNLIRSYLTKAPQFGLHELQALNESNAQLLHIGRNLNQMARQLNTSLAATDQLKAEAIEQLSGEIKSHVRTVSALIRANIERWELK